MALTATIFKAEIQIADMDRNYYGAHHLTLARHPSETDERMMVRLLAFVLHADERLVFTKGLCADDEPDLWQKDLTGDIERWIDVGLPDEKRVRKACHRAGQVAVYAYGRSARTWWNKNADALKQLRNLHVFYIPPESVQGMENLVSRSMRLHCTVQDKQIWLSDDESTAMLEPECWHSIDG